jgi:hypothetical protein
MRPVRPPVRILLICLTLTPGLAADDFTFPLKSDSVRFAVIGDMGTGASPQYEVAQQMFTAHHRFPFEFTIMLGDNIYGGNSPRDFERRFNTPYRPLLEAGVMFYASLGNHDDPNERFYKQFNMNGASYYTFKKGPVQFFALDTNYLDQAQLAWLDTQLKRSSNNEWKVCFFHQPLYSSGMTHGAATDLRLLLEPLFVRYGVNVVFSGHDHVYERIRPQQGIYYFTEGASGQLRKGDLRRTAITARGFDDDRTFMLVEIAGDEMFFQTVSRTGETVDSGRIQEPKR